MSIIEEKKENEYLPKVIKECNTQQRMMMKPLMVLTEHRVIKKKVMMYT